MYKSVEDYDVLRGIFSSKLGTQDITAKAIEAEMRADYQAALKLYSQVKKQIRLQYIKDHINTKKSLSIFCDAHISGWLCCPLTVSVSVCTIGTISFLIPCNS